MYKAIRAAARSIALQIPPLRRLYEFAMRLRDQNVQLAQTVERLRASNAAMGAQLIEQTTGSATALADNARLVRELEATRRDLARREAEPRVQSDDRGREAVLRAERDRARAALARAQAETADAIVARNDTQAQARAQARAVAAELAEAQLRLREAVARANEADMLERRLAESEAKLADAAKLADQLAAVAAERDLLRERIPALERKIEQHQARLIEHAMVEARLALLTSELENRNGGDSEAVSALRAEAATLCAERDGAQARAAELEQQVLDLSSQVAAAHADVATARTHWEQAVTEREATRAEIDKVNRELRLANAENMTRLLSKLSYVEYSMHRTPAQGAALRPELYLDLLEASLTGTLDRDAAIDPWNERKFSPEIRLVGRDWPERALTMIGAIRMRNLRVIVERLLVDQTPGDLIETGAWRGGACIYMRGILAAYGDRERKVWVADAFREPPQSPDVSPADKNDRHSHYEPLSVSLEEVRANFRRYGLLDERVAFLPGWYKDTLGAAPISRLALLRLDGDTYESTMQALDALYAKLSPGGFVIVDDYGLPGCRQAIDEFRDRHNIADALEDVDGASVFWRKAAAAKADVVVMSDKRRSDQNN